MNVTKANVPRDNILETSFPHSIRNGETIIL